MPALATFARPWAAVAAAAVAVATGAGHAQAATTAYSLAGGFSNTANPNGVWSFTQGSAALIHFTPTGGHPLEPGVADGWWGVESSLAANMPFVAKTTVNGASVAGYSNDDFLADQVIVRSGDFGPSAFVRWTAPAAGTVDFSTSAWYVHSAFSGVNELRVTLDGVAQGGLLTINDTSYESHRQALSVPGLTVATGSVLSVEIRKKALQDFGSITGLEHTVLFTATPVPEPATYGLMLVGLLGVGAVARRRAGSAQAGSAR